MIQLKEIISPEQIELLKKAVEKPKPNWFRIVADCCGGVVHNTDIELCPDCKEHCTFVDLNSNEDLFWKVNKNI